MAVASPGARSSDGARCAGKQQGQMVYRLDEQDRARVFAQIDATAKAG